MGTTVRYFECAQMHLCSKRIWNITSTPIPEVLHSHYGGICWFGSIAMMLGCENESS